MSKKLICCSFEKGIPYVLITLNNGVHPDRNGHVSGTFKCDKELFNKACKDRVLFNEIFDNIIDVRLGWQNALADAISNAQNLNVDDVDIGRLMKAAGAADVNIRGEEAVEKDLDELEKENEKIEEAITKELKKKAKKTSKKGVKHDEVEYADGPARTEDSSEVTGSADGDEVSAVEPRTDDIAQGK